jgi:hypothetical protein
MRSPAISVPTGMNGIQQWCRVTVVGPDGTELAFCRLVGPGAPDPWGGVDDVARLALLAGHLGGDTEVPYYPADRRSVSRWCQPREDRRPRQTELMAVRPPVAGSRPDVIGGRRIPSVLD